MRDVLDRWASSMKRSIAMSVGRAIVRLVNDTGETQLVQIGVLDGETMDKVEHLQDYGFTSRAGEGAEGVLLAVAGQRGASVIIKIADTKVRLKGLETGEVAVYDDLGQMVKLGRERMELISPTEVKVTAPKFTVDASTEIQFTSPKIVLASDDLELGAEGGPKVARVGDSVAGGVITTGSDKVKSA